MSLTAFRLRYVNNLVWIKVSFAWIWGDRQGPFLLRILSLNFSTTYYEKRMILHVKNCSKFGYLRRKVVFLFGLSCWDLLNPWKIWNTLPWSWYHWKALKGAPSWFHNVLIMVEKLLNNFSLNFHWNQI
jgi:hypothetical protein